MAIYAGPVRRALSPEARIRLGRGGQKSERTALLAPCSMDSPGYCLDYVRASLKRASGRTPFCKPSHGQC